MRPWIARSTSGACAWRRWLATVIAVFVCAPAGATNFVLACGTWDATTSTFTPYAVGAGSDVSTCPSGDSIWVDVDSLGFDAFGGLTPAQGAELAGAVIGLWAFAWCLRKMRELI